MEEWKKIRQQTEQKRIAQQIKAGRRVKMASRRRSSRTAATMEKSRNLELGNLELIRQTDFLQDPL